MPFNPQPGERGGNQIEELSLQQRLERRDKHLRIAVVRASPKIGQMTLEEFKSLDPERKGDNSFSSLAWVTVFPLEGKFTREQLIQGLIEEEGDEGRATATVDNLIQKGLFEIRDGRVYSNMEIMQEQTH